MEDGTQVVVDATAVRIDDGGLAFTHGQVTSRLIAPWAWSTCEVLAETP